MFLAPQRTKSNATAVLTLLINKLKVPVADSTIHENLNDHPNYPSLLAISDCLSSWKIPHESYSLESDFPLQDLHYPFIAHLKMNGGNFILVNGFKNGTIHFDDEVKTKRIIQEDSFRNLWDGVLLYAERGTESGEENYRSSFIHDCIKTLRLPFTFLVILILVVSGINWPAISLGYVTLLAVNLAGIVVCTMLVVYSMNANNPLIANICSLAKKSDCNVILRSDAAKVTRWLNWGEVGLFYFMGSFICLLVNPMTTSILIWLNIFGLSYTFYSIAYQLIKRNWCILCCTVQILLWMSVSIFISAYPIYAINELSVNLIGKTVLLFLIPIAIWGFLKPYFNKAFQYDTQYQQLKKFKYNGNLFNSLLISQLKYEIPIDLSPIHLGNKQARTVITIVSNPFCSPCKKAHKVLDSWLEVNDEILVEIIFTAPSDDDIDRLNVVKHFYLLNRSDNEMLIKQGLSRWFGQEIKNYEHFASLFPVEMAHDPLPIIEYRRQWCDFAEIDSTPTILVNGYKLVDPYNLEDIKFLLN
jgi:hypothetical protein